jgi:DNA polymerase III delta subunit
MLHAFFGNDTPRVRQKAFDFLRTISDEEASVTYITSNDYKEGMIADLAGSVSLFGGGQIYLIDTLSEDQIMFLSLLEHLTLLQESSHTFILIESAITAPEKKKIIKYASSAEEITADTKERFNAFLLTDALLRKDKKSLWLLLTEAWREGLSNEEIIGILLWQVKVLRLVGKTKSPEEAGQKPFVYNKAKQALSSFKNGEADQISRELLTIYHEGHAGKVDTSIALEQWVLKLKA